MKNSILFGILFLLGCLFILQGLTSRSEIFSDQYSQTAPEGMVLVQSDSLLPYYISVTEEPNIYWQTYIRWLKNIYVSYPEVYKHAFPKDTMGGLWLQYNDPLLQDYSRHPAFLWYPVTGVTWYQAKSYMEWKTDRLNEMILHKAGIIEIDMERTIDENNFNTEAYMVHQYEPEKGKGFDAFNKSRKKVSKNYVEVSDGILFPQFRLPTEAEWESGASYVSNPVNGHLILACLNHADFLEKWMVSYQLTNSNNRKKFSNADNAGINFYGGISEWLLDVDTYLQGVKKPEHEVLLANGWHGYMDTNPLDQYGEINEKDSLGRLPFRFVQVSNINYPIYLTDPRLKFYRGRNAYVPNIYFHKSEEFMDSILKIRYKNYFEQNSQLYNNDFKAFLKSLNLDATQQITKDSLSYAWVNELISDNMLLKRKYVVSNFKDRKYAIAFLEQSKASPYLGFRCVLPYTGTPVKKGYKVKW